MYGFRLSPVGKMHVVTSADEYSGTSQGSKSGVVTMQLLGLSAGTLWYRTLRGLGKPETERLFGFRYGS